MATKTSAKAVKKAVSKAAGARRRDAKHAGAPSAEPAIPPIVGIGASAGGLEAFTQLLSALPTDTGLAFVLVQHLEPTHKSVLTPLLARATKIPVAEVREGMHVEPNHVYVIPANADLSLLDGLLHIVGRKATAGRHLPIDYFFTSLAESRGAQAIGVILSGTASDGTAGVKAIKEAGGITFAQAPESAKFDGMPRNAIGSGCVDLVLPPERIAQELARIIRHPFAGLLSLNAVPLVPGEEEDWSRLFRVLRTATGVDFSLYKKSTVKRRLARRMAVCKADKLRTYLNLLETNHTEVEALFEELLILVTEFFRDPEVFLALEQKIFPKILQQKPPGEAIRIWVAGCSTGEEAYSIAISLLQSLGEKASGTQIQIFGTDVSEKAVDKARVGIYSAADVKPIPAQRLRRYFTASNGGFRVNEAVRELCVFARHDLTRDPPFSKLDLISCRNVLIYMEPALQKRILASFHYGLRPNGILLLGKSESLGTYGDLFTARDRKNKFFKKTEGAHVPVTFMQPIGEHAQPARAAKDTAAGVDLEREAAQMVWEHYGHAGLVVNGDLQIIHFLGDTSPYVRHAPGRASLQLMRTLRDEFVLEVRAAVQKVRRGEPLVRREGIEFRRNSHMAQVTIEVRRLMRSGPEKWYLILFEQTGVRSDPATGGTRRSKTGKAAGKEGKKSRDHEVVRLRGELARTRDYVQAIIRDQEATNEELKTANEEALSSMEELQSTNEELETAKEELQSSNEELVTLNEQLQNRNSELGQLTTDLGNVLSGVNIPIVILGADRRIRRFTPPAEKLLGLIAGDIGRPIGNLRIGVNVPDLDGLIALAVGKGVGSSRDVQSDTGQWYSLRVHPFVGEDKVQGVLMAFVDITEVKELQERDAARAKVSEATVHAVMDSAGQAILVADKDSRIVLANATSENMFGYPRDVLLGQRVGKLLPERLRGPYAEHSASWFKRPQNLSGLELAALRADGSEFEIQVNLSSIVTDGETRGVAFVSDITERRKGERTLGQYRDQLTSEVSALDRLRQTNEELWQCHDLRSGLEQMVDAGIALLGADMGNIQLLNPETHMLEIAAQRGFGREFREHFREVSAEETSACTRSLRSKQRIIVEDVELDPEYAPHRAVAAAAGYRAVQSTPLNDENGTPIGMFSTHFRKPHRPSDLELVRFDLYASQAAQFIQRLRSDAQLQKLTRALLMSQEEGNRQIARELHDVFSQELVAIGMELSSLKKDSKPEAKQAARLSELSQKLTELAKRLHQTSRNLHPAVLEELGLEPALRQECDSFQSASGIPTDFATGNVPAQIPLEMALCLYRVAQEALRNIQKHTQNTDQVWVSLMGSPGGITLVVRDRGNGFELDTALRKGGLGLISMEERVRAENGRFTVQSELGKGTTVTACLPLQTTQAENAARTGAPT